MSHEYAKTVTNYRMVIFIKVLYNKFILISSLYTRLFPSSCQEQFTQVNVTMDG